MSDYPELKDYIRILAKAKGPIAALVIVALAVALFVSLTSQRLYEAEGLLEIGKVWGGRLENPYLTSELLNSMPILKQVSTELGLNESLKALVRMPLLRSEVLEAGPSREAVLIRLRGRGRTPDEATNTVQTATRLIVERHTQIYESLLERYNKYEEELEKQVTEIRLELDRLGELLRARRTNPGVNAPAVILMQSQLEEKQTQYLEFQKELRDVRLQTYTSFYSKNTKLAAGPGTPEAPVSPRILLNLILAGLGALTLGIVVAFSLHYFKTD